MREQVAPAGAVVSSPWLKPGVPTTEDEMGGCLRIRDSLHSFRLNIIYKGPRLLLVSNLVLEDSKMRRRMATALA